MKTLEAYLTDAVANGVTTIHTLTVKPRSCGAGEDGKLALGPVTFYIHPQGVNGETLDFEVHGNVLATDPSIRREGE